MKFIPRKSTKQYEGQEGSESQKWSEKGQRKIKKVEEVHENILEIFSRITAFLNKFLGVLKNCYIYLPKYWHYKVFSRLLMLFLATLMIQFNSASCYPFKSNFNSILLNRIFPATFSNCNPNCTQNHNQGDKKPYRIFFYLCSTKNP